MPTPPVAISFLPNGLNDAPAIDVSIPLQFDIPSIDLPLEQLADSISTIPLVDFGTDDGTLQVDFGNVSLQLNFIINLDQLPDDVSPSDRILLRTGDNGTQLSLSASINDGLDTIEVTLGGVESVSLGPVDIAFATQDINVATHSSGNTWTVDNVSNPELAYVLVDGDVRPSTDYTLSGDELEFSTNAPPTNAEVYVIEPMVSGGPDPFEPAEIGFGLSDSLGDYISPADIAASDVVFDLAPAMLGVNMPVSLPVGPDIDDPIRMFFDPADPSATHFEMPNLSDALNDLPDEDFECNVSQIADGIHKFLDAFELAVNNRVISSLPFVSPEKLDEFNTFIGDLRSVADPLILALSSGEDMAEFLARNLGKAPGTGLKLDILRDEDATGNPISVTSASQFGTETNSEINNAQVFTNDAQGRCFEFDIRIGGSFSVETDFDLGLDAFVFEVETNGGITLTVDYEINMGFGISKSAGVYFIVDPDPEVPEIELTVNASLTPGSSLSAELLFLQVTVEERPDDPPPDDPLDEILTGFTGSVSLDVNSPSDSERVGLAELASTPLTELLTPDFGVTATLDLLVTLGAGFGGDNAPELYAELQVIEWDVAAGLDGTSAANFQIIAGLGLGNFFLELLQPVTSRLDSWLKPIRPLIDFLETPVPVYSQVLELAGQDPIDVAGFINMTGFGGPSLERFLEILEVIGIIDGIVQGLEAGVVEFGSIEFDLNRLYLAEALTTEDREADGDDLQDPQGTMEQGAFPQIAALTARLNEIGIGVPIVENPLSIFNLFFGQDVDLIRYDGPSAEGGGEAAARVAVIPPVLFATLGAEFNAYFDILKFVIDTYGITHGGNFFNGFYFDASTPVAGANAVVTVGAELDAVIGKGGVRGGVDAGLEAKWNEITADGKFRFPELVQRASQGLHCIFGLGGTLDAFVELFVKVGPFKKNKRLIDERLIDFEVSCGALPEPNLGEVVGGELILHVGPNAPKRQIQGVDGNERLKVSYDESEDAILVEGFGTVKSFPAATVDLISGDFGEGNDQIVVDQSVTAPTEFNGGPGNDRLVGGSGMNTLYGDGGDDWLVGGPMGDTIEGGDGDDYIEGLGGADTLRGQSGDDTLDGGEEGDTLTGGTGDDQLVGGGGSDDLDGGEGNDHLDGGDGDDTNLDGGPGDDNIQGGDGVDTLLGGSGNDVLDAGPQDDTLNGGPGNDELIAGDGNDDLIGGDGSDVLRGGEGNDDYIFADLGDGQGNEKDTLFEVGNDIETLSFELVSDDVSMNLTSGWGRHSNGDAIRRIVVKQPQRFEHIVGGDGDDTLVDNERNNIFTGGEGNDLFVFGPFSGQSDEVVEDANAGIDGIDFSALPTTTSVDIDLTVNGAVAIHSGRTLTANGLNLENAFGGSADDEIIGNLHENWLVGNGGIDTISGLGGDDVIEGSGGADVLNGNAGMDQIHGGPDNDQIFGGANNDTIFGNGGADTIEGNAGDDRILGNAGDDRIFGGTRDQIIAGDDSDTIFGGDGIDTIFGQEDGDEIHGNQGDDKIFGGAGNDTINGNAGEDRIFGEQGFDTIHGGPHRDFILGGFDNDNINGGSGDDLVSGGADLGTGGGLIPPNHAPTFFGLIDLFGDVVDGGSGHDLVIGGHPTDLMFEPDANPDLPQIPLNLLVISHFMDMLVDEENPDPDLIDPSVDYTDPELSDEHNFILALETKFVMRELAGGEDNDDIVHGGSGNDLVIGGEGTDYLFGDFGNDALFPFRLKNVQSNENDRVEGGPDNDLLCGTQGQNWMIGGTSDHNVDYILTDPGVPAGGPFSGGYEITSCETDVPEFVEPLPVEIHGQKFHDVNGNFRRDPDEPGLDGWTIELRDAEGELIASTVTVPMDLDEDGVINPFTETGRYSFTDISVGGNVADLIVGTYSINEVPQTGYLETLPGAPLTGVSTEIELPNGIVAQIDTRELGDDSVSTYTISLEVGQIAEDVNFGNAKLGTIRGVVWEDVNGNGVHDLGEPVRSGWTVFVDDDGNGNPDMDEPITTTNAHGEYAIEDLSPGDHCVRAFTLDINIQFSFPQLDAAPPCPGYRHLVSLDYNQTIHDVHFGNYSKVQIRGNVFEDANADGVRDGDDDGLPSTADGGEFDWRVFMDENQDGQWQDGEIHTFTDSQGDYEFDDLTPGFYTVAVSLPDDWYQSFPSLEETHVHSLETKSGDIVDNIDFGAYQLASITVSKLDIGNALFVPGWTMFLDLNANDTLDLDAGGIPTEPFGQTEGVGTGETTFEGLVPGSYVVAEVMQEGWTQVAPGEDVDGNPGSILVSLTSGEQEFAIFQNLESPRIEGIQWYDINGNGVREKGEPGLANWTVYLDTDDDGEFDAFDPFNPDAHSEPFTVTAFDDPRTEDIDETGLYSFDVKFEGSTVVRHLLPDGWIQTAPGTHDSPAAHELNLNAGDLVTMVNFGAVRGATIEGFKWNDRNGDGLRRLITTGANIGDSDVGLNGFEIEIENEAGVVVSTFTTDFDLDGSGFDGIDNNGNWDRDLHDLGADNTANTEDEGEGDGIPTPGEHNVDEPAEAFDVREAGFYRFDRLPPGTYTVREVIPIDGNNWQQTVPGDAANSEYTIEIADGEIISNVDFANVRAASISGIKWSDTNRDGMYDKFTEPTLSGWSIFLDLDFNGFHNDDEPIRVTNASGEYRFDDLLPGTYVVMEIVPGELEDIQTFPGRDNLFRHVVRVAENQHRGDKNFGNQLSTSVHGTKWDDTNGDGVRQADEPGLEGWTIFLDRDGDGLLDPGELRQVTDKNGEYWFLGLDLGTHVVAEVMQSGWMQTYPGSPSVHTLKLSNGEIAQRIDFGNHRINDGQIRGAKWNDLDGDGERDSNEPGLANWTIYFDQNQNGTLDREETSTITDANGNYAFTGLAAGTYIVAEVHQTDWQQTFPQSPGTHLVVVSDGGTIENVDFGNHRQPTGEIRGAKWNDLDGDGERDSNEPGLANWTIYFDQNQNGMLDRDETSTITDTNGNYAFLNLADGTYILAEVAQRDWQQTFPTAPGTHLVVLNDGQAITGLNFGNRRLPTGQLRGTKWNDLDRDGTRDAGEPGIQGVTIYLDQNNNGQFDREESSTVTDANGNYQFLNLAASTYIVTEVLQAGWEQTFPTAPGTHRAELQDGETVERLDFGNSRSALTGEIRGTAWDDLNRDGVRQSNEPGLERWTIYLDANNNGQFDRLETSTTTDANGEYVLSNLSAGTYVVAEVIQPDWIQTFPGGQSQTHTIQLAGGEIRQDVDFGNVSLREPGVAVAAAAADLITGTVFWDKDGDGHRDQEDIGLPGRRVYIDENNSGGFEDGEQFVDTDSSGNYSFTILNNQTYLINQVPVFGWSITTPQIRPVVVVAGAPNEDIDFGNHAQGLVEGWKYHDLNCNGEHDAGEPGMEGVTIYVDLNNNGQFDSDEPFDVTGESGQYLIDNVPPGPQIIREIVPDGFTQSHPSLAPPGNGGHFVNVGTGAVLGGDFLNFQHTLLTDGDDIIFGFRESDSIYGDNLVSNQCLLSIGGDDHLFGLEDDDLLVGQLRNDTYHFGPATNIERDTIVELEGLGTNRRTDEGIHDRLEFDGEDINDDRELEIDGLAADELVRVNLSGSGPWPAGQIAGHGGPSHDVHIIFTGEIAQHAFIEDVVGGAGDDAIIGNDANNRLVGRSGADDLRGGLGNDTLLGEAGNDRLRADEGRNELNGGSDDDTYRFDANAEHNIIEEDREQGGTDTLDFTESTSGITIDLDEVNTNQVIDVGGQIVRLRGWVEDFVGSNQPDTVTVGLTEFARDLDGEAPAVAPGDTLLVNGNGNEVPFDDGQIVVDGFAPIVYEDFETLIPVNSPTVTIDAGESADDGNPDTFTVSATGSSTIVAVNGEIVYSVPTDDVPRIIIQGSGDDDALQVVLMGEPIPNGLVFFGEGQISADTLILFGAGEESGLYEPDPETFGNGSVTIGESTIKFFGLEPVIVHDMASFTFVSPGSDDNVIIDSTADGQNRIHGTSDGVPFESLAFQNVPAITIDVESNDSNAGGRDTIVFESDLVAEGLALLTLQTSNEDSVDASLVTSLESRFMDGIWIFESPDSVPGDLNGDGTVDIVDVELHCGALANGDSSYDLNSDGIANDADFLYLIRDVLHTDLGDSNLDGIFNSGDLVQVFIRGEYEDLLVGNSNWGDGDWNCDGEFGTTDLVVAFQAGSYVAAAVVSDHDAMTETVNALHRPDMFARFAGAVRFDEFDLAIAESPASWKKQLSDLRNCAENLSVDLPQPPLVHNTIFKKLDRERISTTTRVVRATEFLFADKWDESVD